MLKIKIRGIVQGVGFRPFVFRLANDLGIKGYILNTSSGVEMELEGGNGSLQQFLDQLKTKLPEAARIDGIDVQERPDQGYENFLIRESERDRGATLISPDLATCAKCLSELKNPQDRRHRYPFINCTNCGPRYSIIELTPYDRINTTMRNFKMCTDCAQEYNNPLDRRFHAQPNACTICGPSYYLTDPDGNKIEGEPLIKTKELLLEGTIVGIKGIGGFHIAVDPRNETAVAELRRRKNRPHKPFAMMSRLENIEDIVKPENIDLLTSPQAPIILLPKKYPSPVTELVAPNNPYLGIFLPYTPIHHLLLDDNLPYLIMTSANLADEPIAIDKEELGTLCDFYLTNNRPIANRADDSIIFPTALGPTLLRRSRGYVPDPIDLPISTVPSLACGGELKGTFALSNKELLFLSPHLGDLESKKTMDFFTGCLKKYQKWFKIDPELVAYDLHPDYLTTRFAQGLDLPRYRIQHHHAHIASVLVDNCCNKEVIGIAYDGTGYGSDGNIWGGEILICDLKSFKRPYHLRYLPLPGGDEAIKRPIRIAISYLITARENIDFLKTDINEERVIRKQLETGFNVYRTSSLGRLFDCVSAMLALFDEISFEAQAAMALEHLSYNVETDKSYPYNINDMTIDPVPIIKSIARDIRNDVEKAIIARAFHNTIINFTREVVQDISKREGINTVALSGGVFQNRLILNGIAESLDQCDFEVLIHHKLPPNDGCISAGQIAIANVSRNSC